jgi:hypothetical protein
MIAKASGTLDEQQRLGSIGTTRSREDSEMSASMTKHHPLRGPALSRIVAAVVAGHPVEPSAETIDPTDADTTAGVLPADSEERADAGNARSDASRR